MGDAVERALEETVPLLRGWRRLKLLSENELVSVVQRRRDHEYSLRRPGVPRAAFLRYAAFERELGELLHKRALERSLPSKRARRISQRQSARVGLVYSRAIRKFKRDDALYLQYARHCIATGSRKAAERVLARAIAHRGDSEEVWCTAIAYHFDASADPRLARGLAQRSLRALPRSSRLWKEYFRMEVVYVAKLIAKRVTLGMTPSPEAATADRAKPISEQPSDTRLHTDVVDTAPDLLDRSETEPLTFWQGGVPYVIFKSAVASAALSPSNAMEYLQIAREVPFCPPELLTTIATWLKDEHGAESEFYSLVVARSKFDALARKVEAERAAAEVAAAREAEKNSEEVVQPDGAKWIAVLSECVVEIANELEALELANGGDDSASAFGRVAKEIRTAVASNEDVNKGAKARLRAAVAQCLQRISKTRSNSEARSTRSQRVEDLKSADDWIAFLERRIGEDLRGGEDSVSSSVREKLGELVCVPFRNAALQKLAQLWLSWESTPQTLRQSYAKILAHPPLDEKLLWSCIVNEKRLLRSKEPHSAPRTDAADESLASIRTLYTRLGQIDAVARTVAYWQSLVEFERDIAGCAQGASDAQRRARRRLNPKDNVLLQEQLLLRGMS